MSESIKQKSYRFFTTLVEKNTLQSSSYIKLGSEGMMDLSIDKLDENRFSLAHNFVQNGDLMADPDCEIVIDWDKNEATCMTYQQDCLGIYQCADDNPVLQEKLTSFLSVWLCNLGIQGYSIKAIRKTND